MRRATSAQAEERCASTRSVMSSIVTTLDWASPGALAFANAQLHFLLIVGSMGGDRLLEDPRKNGECIPKRAADDGRRRHAEYALAGRVEHRDPP